MDGGARRMQTLSGCLRRTINTQCDSPARGQVGSGTMLLSRVKFLPLNGPALMTKHNPPEMRLQQAIVFLLTIGALSVIHERLNMRPQGFHIVRHCYFPFFCLRGCKQTIHECMVWTIGKGQTMNELRFMLTAIFSCIGTKRY